MVNKWIKASSFRWHFDIHLWTTKFTAESPFASCNVNRFVRCHLIRANIWSTHNFTPLPAAIFARNAQNCVILITMCINIAGEVQTTKDSDFFRRCYAHVLSTSPGWSSAANRNTHAQYSGSEAHQRHTSKWQLESISVRSNSTQANKNENHTPNVNIVPEAVEDLDTLHLARIFIISNWIKFSRDA